ncbi:MAG: YggS family pyridoxal phosphate-dependent enzyme [Desulfovibrio sp.]|nr:YggS family pyridoxal phosphate-dependent enzyme [Desulfovibrio sp.]
MSAQALLERYATVREGLTSAARASGREPSAVRLLAVSKKHSVEDMLALYAAGQSIFGENYVQEALAKAETLSSRGIDASQCLHMIGHVQSKKAPQVAGHFALIHSLDSRKLADALEKRLTGKARQPVLVEVNIADEAQKSGLAAQDLDAFAEYLQEHCPHLALEGLMCLPPVFDQPESARPFFARLRKLNESLRLKTGLPLPELSMGMSGDYVSAIAEGASIVRIGTAIFGPRI